MTPNKTDKLYNALLPLKVVTFDDIVYQASKVIQASVSREYVGYKYISKLVATDRLEPIRKRLYAVISPYEREDKFQPEKLLIASKIRKDYYLGFHTALEYYGSSYSTFNEAYVSIKSEHKFKQFRYRGLTFKPVQVRDSSSNVLEKPYGKNTLKVSSKERTFIECVDRPRYAGGWEECLKSLDNLSGINFEKLVNLVAQQKSKSLPRRVGYVLELLKNRSPFYEHIDESVLEEIEHKIESPPRYLISGKKGHLNRRWKLIIPEDFEEQLISV